MSNKAICKNCLLNIKDLRKETHCSVCGQPLHKDCAIKDGGTFYCDVCYTVHYEEKTTPNVNDIIIPDVIRRSHIETYKSCPYKFYMEVIKGIEDPSSVYATIGIDLHELFSKACHDKNYVEQQMVENYLKIWDNYNSTIFEDEQQQSTLKQRALNSIKNFYIIKDTLPETPHSTEEQIIFDIGEGLPKISTTSDRIDEIDGELELSDWKTGKTMVGKKISSDLQAPLYIYGVRQKYNMPIRKFTFYYLNEKKTRTFTRVTNDDYLCVVRKREYFFNVTDAIREVQKLFSQINKGKFNVPTNQKESYFVCKMCHLRKAEICKGAYMESWTQNNF